MPPCSSWASIRSAAYHVEIDGEEMIEETADPGGIIYLPSVPPGGVRLGPAPVTS